jgi:cobalamin biosynthesis Mg chelatase CobN
VILEAAEIETVPTTAADVESAGRSCMAIVIILALIVLVLLLWLTLRSIGVGS